MSSEGKEHAFPNNFAIPPSNLFDRIEKSSNIDDNLLPSSILPFNSFLESFNTCKVENIERSDNVPLIYFPQKINSCSEFLEHRQVMNYHWKFFTQTIRSHI